MKERPILFSSEMVKAILEGQKTMTRRIMKVQPPNDGGNYQAFRVLDGYKSDIGKIRWINKDCLAYCVNTPHFSLPYGEIGDRLWVRETWYYEEHMHDSTEGTPDLPGDLYSHRLVFKADCPDYPVNVGVGQHGWRPSIFMPRWASRITLEITDIRAERLQDITEEDAEREGVSDEWPILPVYDTAKKRFRNLWDSINGGKPGKTWQDNPWVWVVEFRRFEK